MKVAIIGAGIAGLATAALLSADGHEVNVFEQRENVGGRAGSIAADGFRFDTGPSWYLMPDVFDHFFELFGTSAEKELDLRVLDPAYRVFYEEGEPLDIARDFDSNVATFDSVEAGAGRKLADYVGSAQEAYDLALKHFLYTNFTDPTNLLVSDVIGNLPKLAPLLTQSLETFVGKRFSDNRLRQILGYPAVFLGSSPERTPSLYHLMSALDLTGGVMYPQGGFTALIDAIHRLATSSGATVTTGASVTSILTDPLPASSPRRVRGRRARAAGLVWRDGEGIKHRHEADLVVGAGDLFHGETKLLPPSLQTFPASWWDKRESGPGAVLVLLGVRGQLPEMPHHSLFFTTDWRENFDAIREGRMLSPASAYVCKPSETDPSVAPEGHENLFILIPVPAAPAIGRGGADGAGDSVIERAADDAIAQISAWANIPDLAERIVVRRTIGPGDFAADLSAWRGGMLGPAHTLGQSAMFRAGNRSRRVDGLYYAGSSTIPGIGLPMCLISAELVLKHVRGDRSPNPVERLG
ncbi:phytoene desaturase family protein [Flaviflexus equikiangi]|uniref:Phytoene desaturase n=1 Tax=Flaviflexus equikiangi TaxID=2758573 RepID=A0ABS2TEH3_9ACTO|nr:phytoene desaturase family protein [Flaviflexus equikiangi]MBM9433058.1 phytoene desaturase [Flaviflexus equikiangi]